MVWGVRCEVESVIDTLLVSAWCVSVWCEVEGVIDTLLVSDGVRCEV